jgi:UDP-N-acetylmuramate--alanine ligase
MSGLAEILVKEGFTVTGSDIHASETTEILTAMGVQVMFGQIKENISPDIDVVVYTAAISPDNEELCEAKRQGIPLLTRAQMLGQIMANYKYSVAVSGTHGKTTTTSMLTHILLAADTDPTISIGGMLDVIGGNIRVGNSDYFVTEACEYTNSFHAFQPYISIILNVDADHLDFFSGIEEIADSFATFAKKLPDDGLLVVNGDMEYLEHVTEGLNCEIITFGFGEGNKYRAVDITMDENGCPTYTLLIDGQDMGRITLHSTGKHNAMNSLSAIAVARHLGVSMDNIRTGLLNCSSAKRRFEYKGTLASGVRVIDDYAHHPTEISASLAVARSVTKGEVWCAFQPHTYTRTYALLPEFAKALSAADHVILADIYAAREKDTGMVSSKDLAEKISQLGTDVVYLGDFSSIEKFILKNCKKNDLLITMGAGNIVDVGESLLSN